MGLHVRFLGPLHELKHLLTLAGSAYSAPCPDCRPPDLSNAIQTGRSDWQAAKVCFSRSSSEAKLKAMLRKAATRTLDTLWNTFGRITETFTSAECANYFAAAGYDAD